MVDFIMDFMGIFGLLSLNKIHNKIHPFIKRKRHGREVSENDRYTRSSLVILALFPTSLPFTTLRS